MCCRFDSTPIKVQIAKSFIKSIFAGTVYSSSYEREAYLLTFITLNINYGHNFQCTQCIVQISFSRFKCPVCPKRFAKVQNFKLHIIKHVAPSNTKVKHCRHCNQLVPNAEFSKHLQDKHEVVLHQCGDCNQAFSRMSFLRAHQEKHLAKLKGPPQTFPSETK